MLISFLEKNYANSNFVYASELLLSLFSYNPNDLSKVDCQQLTEIIINTLKENKDVMIIKNNLVVLQQIFKFYRDLEEIFRNMNFNVGGRDNKNKENAKVKAEDKAEDKTNDINKDKVIVKTNGGNFKTWFLNKDWKEVIEKLYESENKEIAKQCEQIIKYLENKDDEDNINI